MGIDSADHAHIVYNQGECNGNQPLVYINNVSVPTDRDAV